MMKFADLIPQPTNRAFICGMTGCGKSVLAERLLQYRNSVLIYDAKDEIFWKGYKRFSRLQNLIDSNVARAIYAPNIKELNDPRYWDWFFKFGFLRGKKLAKKLSRHKDFIKGKTTTVTIYVDETYAVTDGQELPFYYKAALTRGRSIGVEVWSSTQRPIDIPQFLMSESENKYIFFLEMPQDKEKVRKMTGISEQMIESLSMDNHEFIFRNRNVTSNKLKLTGVS